MITPTRTDTPSKAKNMRVELCETVDEAVVQADFITLHMPKTPETTHLINAERIEKMKPGVRIVNCARGGLIDESALLQGIKDGKVAGAALDVFEDEPAMKPGLRELDNVVVVPHIASATRWTREGMAILAASNVAAILRGWPVSTNPDRIHDFISGNGPEAAPSIVNAADLDLQMI